MTYGIACENERKTHFPNLIIILIYLKITNVLKIYVHHDVMKDKKKPWEKELSRSFVTKFLLSGLAKKINKRWPMSVTIWKQLGPLKRWNFMRWRKYIDIGTTILGRPQNMVLSLYMVHFYFTFSMRVH